MELPEEIIEAINYEVGRYDLEYADNYRAFRKKDDLYWDEYAEAIDTGCCGFHDVSYVDTNGDEWVIGCNYGH